MVQLQLFTPTSLGEAVGLLAQYGADARVIAGGSDLLAKRKKGTALSACVVNIKNVRELDFIDYDPAKGLRIGALATMAAIAGSPQVRAGYAALAEGAESMGSPVIRLQATIGGNLCNAAPSADTVPALLVLGAQAKIVGAGGERVVPVEELFVGPGKTCLLQGEILTEIQIPLPPPHSGTVYLRHARRQGADLAVAGVAALVTLDGDMIKDVKIALGAVAPTPIRATAAEGILKGGKPDEALLEEAGRVAAGEARPIDDVRGSADYRRKLVAALTARAVRQAAQSIGRKEE